MTLQASGAISISDLVTEFGGSAPHSLSEYYRGGGLVPDTPTNSGVPTSGTISLTDFYGASSDTGLALTSLASSDTQFGGGTATAGVRTLRDGDVQELVTGSTWTDQNSTTEWIASAFETATVGDDYEVMLSATSGTNPGGPTLEVFHTINVTRAWTLARSTTGTSSFNGVMTIREIASPSNSVSANVSLSASVEV